MSTAIPRNRFEAWITPARTCGSVVAGFLQANWSTLVTFDTSQVTLPGSQRARRASTAACLPVFLKALGYRGTDRHILEATPHLQTGMDIADLRTALVNLGYNTEARHASRRYRPAFDVGRCGHARTQAA